jgi:polyhydroxyalkanoate synthesis regulator phasin
MSDGIKQGIGVLSAFKDALEETIQEARERGDLSTERAKSVMKDALGRAQSAASGARERLDFAHQGELDELRAQVEGLQNRIVHLEGRIAELAQTGKQPAEDRE